ncbi:polysaccharide deacetylase family protein [Arsenicicoccus sp. UBA7492]|uniref:polysaccharide deacetylase family protein n=1 Tax=Arsenicicoccus sp. UBA7492 TaxID=1946057 RepID=UPI00257EE92A|nr:polysaccharide deacetylase family protein [Arsenicicoccus sp. UBA7492]
MGQTESFVPRGMRGTMRVGRTGPSGLGALVVSRRTALTGAVLCAASGAGLAVTDDGRLELALGPTSSPQSRRAADRDCVSYVRTHRPVLSLTFDDGPDPRYTPAVLDLLRRYDARATFFVVGANAAAHPDLVARMRAEGHEVANHTHDHAHLTEISNAEVRDQIARGRRVIGDAGARLLRPPVGRTSTSVAEVARSLGERQAFWSSCLEACLHDGARVGGTGLGEALDPGAVVLAHDGGRVEGRWAQEYPRDQTVEALPHLLEALAARGLSSVPVGELVRSGRIR